MIKEPHNLKEECCICMRYCSHFFFLEHKVCEEHPCECCTEKESNVCH